MKGLCRLVLACVLLQVQEIFENREVVWHTVLGPGWAPVRSVTGDISPSLCDLTRLVHQIHKLLLRKVTLSPKAEGTTAIGAFMVSIMEETGIVAGDLCNEI